MDTFFQFVYLSAVTAAVICVYVSGGACGLPMLPMLLRGRRHPLPDPVYELEANSVSHVGQSGTADTETSPI